MKPEDIESLLRAAFPDGKWRLKDLTGTQDHYELRIASERFAGVSLVGQHRLVYAALAGALDRHGAATASSSDQQSSGTCAPGPIHALALTTLRLEEWT